MGESEKLAALEMGKNLVESRAFQRVVGFWLQIDFFVGRQPVRHIPLDGILLNVPVRTALQPSLELPEVLVDLCFRFPINVLALAVHGDLAEPAAVLTLLGRCDLAVVPASDRFFHKSIPLFLNFKGSMTFLEPAERPGF